MHPLTELCEELLATSRPFDETTISGRGGQNRLPDNDWVVSVKFIFRAQNCEAAEKSHTVSHQS